MRYKFDHQLVTLENKIKYIRKTGIQFMKILQTQAYQIAIKTESIHLIIGWCS